MASYQFAAPLWRWESRSDSWYFITMPQDHSDELRERPLPPRGFGSIKVRATIGATSWSTSVFPDAKRSGCYVLPVKRSVRDAEGIDHEDLVEVAIEVL